MSVVAEVIRWKVPELELAPPVSSAQNAVDVQEVEPEQAPPPPTLEQIQAIQRQAREDGHAEGFLDGQAQGFAQGEAQVRRLIAQIEGILDNFTRPLARLEGEVAAALGELAVRIAGHLVGRAYVAEPQLLAQLVSSALDAAGEIKRSVEVRLHPDDGAAIPLTLPPHVRLVHDPSLGRGDVRVHTDTLRIDGSLSARLQATLDAVIRQTGERA